MLAELYPLPNDWLSVTKRAEIVAGAINLQGSALTTWFNILDYTNAQKFTVKLFGIVVEDNPQCASLCKAYLGEVATGFKPTLELPGITIEERVNAARAGLDAVNKQPRDIQAILAANDQLEGAISSIDTLAAYKNLHDALHSFQYAVGSFQDLFVAARDIGTDKGARELRKFLGSLRLLSQTIRQWIGQLPDSPGIREFDEIWHNDLTHAAGVLQEEIDSRSPGVFEPLLEVRRILRVTPHRLNQQILETAKRLPFGILAAGLGEIAAKLPDDDTAQAPVENAREAILLLSAAISARVREHGLWQDVDNRLYDLMEMIESADRGGGASPADPTLPFQFAPVWRIVKARVQTLITLDAGGRWTRAIEAYTTDVSDLLAREKIDEKFILAFEAYRDEAQQRFVNVDFELKAECASLVRISDPLHRILEELNP